MTHCVLDCCSALNLYTGWAGLKELAVLPHSWHLCSAVIGELTYTRDFGPDGTIVQVPIDLKPLFASGSISHEHPQSELEAQLYVDFATDIDDGEAQTLAIAKSRGLVVVTDDRKAAIVAARPDIGVQVMSTADVLREWCQIANASAPEIGRVLERIKILARYTPHPESSNADWWQSYLNK